MFSPAVPIERQVCRVQVLCKTVDGPFPQGTWVQRNTNRNRKLLHPAWPWTWQTPASRYSARAFHGQTPALLSLQADAAVSRPAKSLEWYHGGQHSAPRDAKRQLRNRALVMNPMRVLCPAQLPLLFLLELMMRMGLVPVVEVLTRALAISTMRMLWPVLLSLLSRLRLMGLVRLVGLVGLIRLRRLMGLLGLMCLVGLLGLLVSVEERWVVRASCGRRLRSSPCHRPRRGNERLGIGSRVWRLLGRGRLMVRGRLGILVLLALVLVPGLLVIEGEIPRRGLMMWDGHLCPGRRRMRGVWHLGGCVRSRNRSPLPGGR